MIGWCIVAALSIPPLLGYLGYRTATPGEQGWASRQQLKELHEAESTFRFNAHLILVLECDEFFQPDRIRALHAAANHLKQMDEVHNLVWLGDVISANLRGQQTALLPGPDEDLTTERLQSAKEALLKHPLSERSLIANDGRTMLMLIDARSKEDVQPVRNAAIRRLEPDGIQTRATGSMALYDIHDRALNEDHIRIQLMAYVLVGAMAVIIFRRPSAIFVAASGPVTGVVWSMGWLRLLGESENELAKIILPVMIIMIGYTDGVHIVVRIRQMRAAGASLRDAVFDAVQLVGPACLLTSITTAIGFGSLMISNSSTIAGFGRASAIGVIVTFLAVILVIPLLSGSRLGNHMHVSASRDPLSRLMNRSVGIISFSSRHARLVTVIGVLITLFCLHACSHLIPNDRLGDRVPHSSEEWQAMRHCDKHMGGVRYLRVIVRWTGDQSRREIWPVIRDAEEALAREELVGPHMSIRTALTVFRGPERRDQSVLVNKLPEDLKSQFYLPDEKVSLIVGRLQDLGMATLEPMFDRIKADLRKLETTHPGFELRLYSDVIVEGKVVRQMIEELLKSLAMASVIIFGVLAIVFRSLRIGLISIIPNVMPLAASGAMRLMINEELGIASACSFAICLGIAVDDTIHYLTHFRHERRRGLNAHEANRNTFVAVGSALMMTTFLMTLGLGTVLTSRLPPHVHFAAMGCTTLAVALPADLLFLPALLSLFPGRSEVDAESKPDGDDSP